MRRLLEYATTGHAVVVWRVDRLGRSLIDGLNTVNLLRESGIGIRSVQDGIDADTSRGRLMLNMLATLAEYEPELITEPVTADRTAPNGAVGRKCRHCQVGRLEKLCPHRHQLRAVSGTRCPVCRLVRAS